MTNYMTIPDAAKYTGKSQSTITRLCRSNKETKRVKIVDKKYLILQSFLDEKFGLTNHDYSNDSQKTTNDSHDYSQLLAAKDEQIQTLQRTIEILSNEMKNKNKLIDDYSEINKALIYQTKNLTDQLAIKPAPTNIDSEQKDEPQQPDKNTVNKMIIDLHNKGFTHIKIAEYLTNKGYRNSHGNYFTNNTILKIIKRYKN